MSNKDRKQTTAQPDAATLEGNTPEAAAEALRAAIEANPLLGIIPLDRVMIAHDPQPAPTKPWSDGTVAQTLASVILRLGLTDVCIPNCRIVFKTLGKARSFDLILPSASRAQGAFHESFLKATKGSEAWNQLEGLKKAIVRRYLAERKEAVEAGAVPVGKMVPGGIPIGDDAELAALGITV